MNSRFHSFLLNDVMYWQYLFLSCCHDHRDDLLSELLSPGIRVFLHAKFITSLDPCYRFENIGHSVVRFMFLYPCLWNIFCLSCYGFTRLSAATKSSLQPVFLWCLQMISSRYAIVQCFGVLTYFQFWIGLTNSTSYFSSGPGPRYGVRWIDI